MFKHPRLAVSALCLLFAAPLMHAQQSLDNAAVIKLTTSGLSEDLIVQTITASPGHYDTGADALIALKKAGVTDKEVGAMLMKNANPNGPVAAAPAEAAAPVDEVGVYYKDKDGKWVVLFPEVVNFKTGGVLKTFATQGIVKGDINGHLQGPTAKTVLTLPITFAVYVPEGTAITEYQLIRLRPSGGQSREFRSVTGGIVHASGGAARDLVQFDSTKLAPRVYTITLKQDAGKGEYGILPPGATASSNMASGGKMYTVSVPE